VVTTAPWVTSSVDKLVVNCGGLSGVVIRPTVNHSLEVHGSTPVRVLKPVLLQPSGCWVGVGSRPSSGDGDFGMAQDDVWRGQVDGWGVAGGKVLAPMVTLPVVVVMMVVFPSVPLLLLVATGRRRRGNVVDQ